MAWAKNIILLVVCLNILLTIFAATLSLSSTSTTNSDLAKIYNINSDYSYGVQNGTSSFYGSLPQDQKAASSEGSGSAFGGWVDPLGTLWKGIKLILNLTFGIFTIPQTLGLPSVISLMFFLPLGVAYILALVSLIRGVDF